MIYDARDGIIGPCIRLKVNCGEDKVAQNGDARMKAIVSSIE